MGIDSWSTTPATNATFDGGAGNWAEGQAPSTVNNTARQMVADVRSAFNDLMWFVYGSGDQGAGNVAVPAVYASGTSFTIAGADVTAVYHANRRVRASGSGTGVIYGSISSSTFNSGNATTTVNVTWDSGTLSNETLVISLSQVPVTGKPVKMASVVDYATGTWTPAITFATAGDLSVVYTLQTGRYTAVGDMVTVWFVVNFTPTYGGTCSGGFTITGLPFTASGITDGAGTIGSQSGNFIFSGGNHLFLELAGSNSLAIVSMQAGGGVAGMTTANIASGAAQSLRGAISYKK